MQIEVASLTIFARLACNALSALNMSQFKMYVVPQKAVHYHDYRINTGPL
jgi:hypothetical protein